MPGTSTPMEYPPSRLSFDSFVAAFRVVNHVGLLHDITIFGAQHLHPCGLRPTVSLSTLHPCRYLMSARLGSDGRLTLSGWLFIQLVITSLAWRTNNLVLQKTPIRTMFTIPCRGRFKTYPYKTILFIAQHSRNQISFMKVGRLLRKRPRNDSDHAL